MNSVVNKSVITCYFYGRSGHTETTCYRKDGFPKHSGKTFKFNRSKKICTHYRRNSRTVETFYKNHGYL